MRVNKMTVALRVSLATGLAAALSLTVTGAVTQGGEPGEACMFNAPDGALHAGHVGWGFRDGTGDNWIYGATEGGGLIPISGGTGAKAATKSWHESGTRSQMLDAFGSGVVQDQQTRALYNDGSGYYRIYRCSQITTSFPGAAMQAITDVETGGDSGYNIAFNNCLTKALIVLGSYGFLNLRGGASVLPNTYFQSDLPTPTASRPGFSGSQYFTTLTIGVRIEDPLNHGYLNPNPARTQRPMTIQIYDQNNNLVYNPGVVAMATLTPAGTDRYQATIQLPTDVPQHKPVWSSGQNTSAYRIRVKLDYTLFSYVPGTVDILQGSSATLPDAVLTVGDINGDNQVNIGDYDILVRCFAPPKGPCTAQEQAGADLNDDGTVDGIDYNEMLRIFTSQEGI